MVFFNQSQEGISGNAALSLLKPYIDIHFDINLIKSIFCISNVNLIYLLINRKTNVRIVKNNKIYVSVTWNRPINNILLIRKWDSAEKNQQKL